jgi:hypothetical protein
MTARAGPDPAARPEHLLASHVPGRSRRLVRVASGAPGVAPAAVISTGSRLASRQPFLHTLRRGLDHAVGYGRNPPVRPKCRAPGGFRGSHGPAPRMPAKGCRRINGHAWGKSRAVQLTFYRLTAATVPWLDGPWDFGSSMRRPSAARRSGRHGRLARCAMGFWVIRAPAKRRSVVGRRGRSGSMARGILGIHAQASVARSSGTPRSPSLMIHVLRIRAPARQIGGRVATVGSDQPRQGCAEIGCSSLLSRQIGARRGSVAAALADIAYSSCPTGLRAGACRRHAGARSSHADARPDMLGAGAAMTSHQPNTPLRGGA